MTTRAHAARMIARTFDVPVKLMGVKRITGKRIVKAKRIPKIVPELAQPYLPYARLVCNVHPKHIAGDPPVHLLATIGYEEKKVKYHPGMPGAYFRNERDCTCMEIYEAMRAVAYFRNERDCTCMEIYEAMRAIGRLMNRAFDNGRDNPRVSGGPFGDMR